MSDKRSHNSSPREQGLNRSPKRLIDVKGKSPRTSQRSSSRSRRSRELTSSGVSENKINPKDAPSVRKPSRVNLLKREIRKANKEIAELKAILQRYERHASECPQLEGDMRALSGSPHMRARSSSSETANERRFRASTSESEFASSSPPSRSPKGLRRRRRDSMPIIVAVPPLTMKAIPKRNSSPRIRSQSPHQLQSVPEGTAVKTLGSFSSSPVRAPLQPLPEDVEEVSYLNQSDHTQQITNESLLSPLRGDVTTASGQGLRRRARSRSVDTHNARRRMSIGEYN